MASSNEANELPDRMQALVLSGANAFAVKEVKMPMLGSAEVLCRVRAVAICGTDVHIIEGKHPGQWPKSYPFIPGHEWSGEVVALGDVARAFGWQMGDRVAGTSHAGQKLLTEIPEVGRIFNDCGF